MIHQSLSPRLSHFATLISKRATPTRLLSHPHRSFIASMSGNAHTAMDEVKGGAFVRTESTYRDWIRADGTSDFAAEAGRYHLYISYACPWASRCLAMRTLKGLEDVVSLSVVGSKFEKTRPDDDEDKHHGWTFHTDDEEAGCIPDPFGAKTIREIYEKVGDTAHKYTVPVLFDKKTKKIVNNESSEIMQMFNKVSE
jgi:putative glutathione S-transferase